MTTSDASDADNPYAVLRHRDFRLYIFCRFLVTLAMMAQATAVSWQVYSLTKDPLSLGLIGLAEVIPAIGFALIAGHIVDRSDRRLILILALGLATGVAGFLWTLSSNALTLEDHTRVALIYTAVFVSGMARAFLSSSQFAFFSQIIPKPLYIRASAWSTTAWQVAAAAGPALGGLAYGTFGVRPTYFGAFALFAAGLAALSLIPGRPVPPVPEREPLSKSLTVGLKFVFSNPIVLSALSLDLFAVLFGGAVALLPVFADILKVGPQGLGLMRAAPSVGAFVMAIFLAHRPPTRHAGPILLAAIAGFGVCMILFGVSRSFWFTMGILALSGALDNISVIVRSTILQLLTPDHMRGRVSAVNSIFISSSNEIGAFESGLTAKWMGTVPAVIFGGTMTLLVVGVTAWLAPVMRTLDLAAVARDTREESA